MKRTLLNHAAGAMRIRGPQMHDNVDGIRMALQASYNEEVPSPGRYQRINPSQFLIAEQSGDATAGNIEQGAFHVYYENLPGVNAHLISNEELLSRSLNICRARQELTAGTSGGYSGEQLLTADVDLFKADTEYALIGASIDASYNVIGIRGIDTGNLRIGLPGRVSINNQLSTWFIDMALRTGLACIPVFNMSNKDSIYVDVTNDEDEASPKIDLIFVELE
jgi:hypothetical protein